MSRLVFPVPLGIVVLLVFGVTGGALLQSAEYLSWPYGDWVAASAETRQSLVLAGPWLAGCCAWTAARFTAQRGILCPASAARSGFPLVKAQLRVLIGWAVLGYVAGLAPVLVSTVLKAEVGSLNWLVFAGSLGALSAFACFGFLIGCILPLPLAALTAVLVSYASMLWAEPLEPVAPILVSGVEAGYEENVAVAVLRLFFFLLVAGCCIGASSWWLRQRTSPMTVVPLFGVLLLVLPLIVGAAAVQQSPDVIGYEANPPAQCQFTGGVEVCVHGARAVLLDDVVDAVDGIRTAWGSEDFPIRRVLEATLWVQPSPPGIIVLDLQTHDRSKLRDFAIQDLASELYSSRNCASNYETVTDPDQFDAEAMSRAPSVWLAMQAGVSSPELFGDSEVLAIAQRLDQMPPAEARELLQRLRPKLTQCTARSTDIP